MEQPGNSDVMVVDTTASVSSGWEEATDWPLEAGGAWLAATKNIAK